MLLSKKEIEKRRFDGIVITDGRETPSFGTRPAADDNLITPLQEHAP